MVFCGRILAVRGCLGEQQKEIEKRMGELLKELKNKLSSDQKESCRGVIEKYVKEDRANFHKQYVLELVEATVKFKEATPKTIFDAAAQLLVKMRKILAPLQEKEDTRFTVVVRKSGSSNIWNDPEKIVAKIVKNNLSLSGHEEKKKLSLSEAFISDWNEVGDKADTVKTTLMCKKWIEICTGVVKSKVWEAAELKELRTAISNVDASQESDQTDISAGHICKTAKELKSTLEAAKDKLPQLSSFLELVVELQSFMTNNSPLEERATNNVVFSFMPSRDAMEFSNGSDTKEADTKVADIEAADTKVADIEAAVKEKTVDEYFCVAISAYIFNANEITGGENFISQLRSEFKVNDPATLMQIFEAAKDYLKDKIPSESSESNSLL